MVCFWLHLFFVITWLSFWEPAEARRARFKPTLQKPKKSEAEKTTEKLAPGQNINIDQVYFNTLYAIAIKLIHFGTLNKKGTSFYRLTTATVVFKRAGKITMKLYGRCSMKSLLDKFKDHAFNLGLDVIFH
uniref:Uncharacterized protein n=1 Tax=Cyprinus carpio TaxID=7962 RepID=A0A8C2IIJ7_CYPCA